MINRSSMLDQTPESWRPPLFTALKNWVDRLMFTLRRLVDLQAVSIWADLSQELATVRGRVLDVGCGAQPYRCLFQPQVKYLGIDTTDAKSHFGYEVPDTKYFEGTAWPVSNCCIDFVLCTEALEHVPNPAQFLTEAARCLVTGGRILITGPFSARWHLIPYDYWRFTPSALRDLLTAAVFQNISVYARGNAVTVASYKVKALILPLLVPQGHPLLAAIGLRLLGVLFLPAFLVLAAIGNLSLLGTGGNDCLGYTSKAEKA